MTDLFVWMIGAKLLLLWPCCHRIRMLIFHLLKHCSICSIQLRYIWTKSRKINWVLISWRACLYQRKILICGLWNRCLVWIQQDVNAVLVLSTALDDWRFGHCSRNHIRVTSILLIGRLWKRRGVLVDSWNLIAFNRCWARVISIVPSCSINKIFRSCWVLNRSIDFIDLRVIS